MAKSALERKQRQIERQRELDRIKPDSTYPFLKEPFFAWLKSMEGQGDWEAAMWHFDASALPQPEFDDDSGPRSIDGEVERMKDEHYDPYAGYEGSIGRAESLVDNLIAAASGIALVINHYKQEK